MENNIRTIHFDAINKNDSKQIIFIHGFAATSEYFHEFYKNNLQNDYSLDTIELPGLGLNEDKIDSYNILSYANYSINLIRENNWKNFILIGHSMGGAIAELICNMMPELVDKAILICPMNTYIDIKILNLIKWKRKNDIDSLKYNLHFMYHDYKEIYKTDDEIKDYFAFSRSYYKKNKIVLSKLVHSFLNLKLRRILKRAEINNHIPTLVLFADDDKIIEAKGGFKRLSKNPNYDIEILNNSGHMLFIEKPENTKIAIYNWLNKK